MVFPTSVPGRPPGGGADALSALVGRSEGAGIPAFRADGVIEIADVDAVAGREEDRALDHVFQLAHVARPVVDMSGVQRGGRDPVDGRPCSFAKELAEALDEEGDVVATLAERRDLDRDDRKPVKKVLPGNARFSISFERSRFVAAIRRSPRRGLRFHPRVSRAFPRGRAGTSTWRSGASRRPRRGRASHRAPARYGRRV